MSVYMVLAVLAFMIGVLIKRFINSEVGETVKVIAAVVYVFAWALSAIRG